MGGSKSLGREGWKNETSSQSCVSCDDEEKTVFATHLAEYISGFLLLLNWGMDCETGV